MVRCICVRYALPLISFLSFYIVRPTTLCYPYIYIPCPNILFSSFCSTTIPMLIHVLDIAHARQQPTRPLCRQEDRGRRIACIPSVHIAGGTVPLRSPLIDRFALRSFSTGFLNLRLSLPSCLRSSVPFRTCHTDNNVHFME
jgi:hypothetical protein